MNNSGQCSKCNQENEYSKTLCDFCGARLPWAAAQSATQTPTPKPDAPTLNRTPSAPLTAQQTASAQGCGKATVGCFGIIIIGFILLWIIGTVKGPAPLTKGHAYQYAKVAIQQQLKSPSTAVFPTSYDSGVRVSERGDTFIIVGFVDSQNGFGAMIRTRWIAQVERSSDGKNMTVVSAKLVE